MNDKNIIKFAADSYSFLLPQNGEFSFKFWVDKINKANQDAGVKSMVIVDELMKTPDQTILRRAGVDYLGDEITRFKNLYSKERRFSGYT